MKHCVGIIFLLTFSTIALAQSPRAQSPPSSVQNFIKQWHNERLREEAQPDNYVHLKGELEKKDYDFLKDIPSISPLKAGESPRISSLFGMRLHPLDGVHKPHLGIDLVCRRGFQFVYVTANGRVNFAGSKKGLGLAVEVSHANGYTTGYGHLDAIYVNQEDQVRIGEVLGVMGSSGKATGVHVHYTISINGTAVDPLPYLTLYEYFIKRKDAMRASLIENSEK
jgi:murein DD-endopeptidase MepM/ murein hydrolase activator NlpD